MHTNTRHLRLVAALALVGASLVLLGGGAFAAVARSGRTYVDLGAHGSYATDRYAVATESTNSDAEGAGTQTLSWNASDSRQVAFAMNADRSHPVRVRVVSSAVTLGRMPWWVPPGLIALGVVLLPTGIRGLGRTIRDRTRS